ncbi:DUF177 domain-containing protein [Magnetospira thiophila]
MNDVTPELSRPMRLSEILEAGRQLTVTASAEECQALARRFEVDAIPELSAEIHLSLQTRGREVRLTGHVSGRVIQPCVVTLEPVETPIEQTMNVVFRNPVEAEPVNEVDLSLESEDDVFPLFDDQIDIGEAIAECFGAQIPIYPKAPGVHFDSFSTEATSDSDRKSDRPNPFSVLAKLNKNR